MWAAYEAGTTRWWQPVSDAQMGALACVALFGAWVGVSAWLVPVTALSVLFARGRTDLAAAAVVLLVVSAACSGRAWADVAPERLGPFEGWAELVTDPAPVGRATGVVLEVDGERFEVFAYGSVARRLSARQAGELVRVSAERHPLDGPFARRAQVRHVVGELAIERVADHLPGDRLALATNRVRGRLRAAAESTMAPDQAALFTGLVIGDDARQPPEMTDRFRRSGLSHLTAVSGQNVGFILAVAGVGLRRLSRWWRLGGTWAVIGWFVVLTRFEPSVLRAATMAGLAATAFALGAERTAARLLALSVIVLVLVDPLLVWSVAFWLSVGATAGVTVVGPWVGARLHGPHWVVAPLSVTIGAQVGAFVPTWLVFQRLPALGVPTNLLAVPVAGFVMLYGIPAALVASFVPGPVAELVMLPARAGTSWVSTVAALADRLAPHGAVAAAVWAVQAVAVVFLWRWGSGKSESDPGFGPSEANHHRS
jgi:competence protein ComEC